MLQMVPKCILALALIACASGRQSPSAVGNSTAVPVFELEESEHGNGVTIDPILLLAAGQIQPVPNPCEEGGARTAFEQQYLKPGTSYTLAFGGVEAGTAIIDRSDPNSSATRVTLHVPTPIKGLTMALAVGSPSVLRRTGLRRDPTTTERNEADLNARAILKSKGVESCAFARLRINQIAVIEFDSGVPETVVSAEIERSDKLGMEYTLFFTVQSGGKASVIWYQHAVSETHAEAVYLVDAIDTDGDGSSELVARRVFYENYRYEVYKRRGPWKEIFKTDVFG